MGPARHGHRRRIRRHPFRQNRTEEGPHRCRCLLRSLHAPPGIRKRPYHVRSVPPDRGPRRRLLHPRRVHGLFRGHALEPSRLLHHLRRRLHGRRLGYRGPCRQPHLQRHDPASGRLHRDGDLHERRRHNRHDVLQLAPLLPDRRHPRPVRDFPRIRHARDRTLVRQHRADREGHRSPRRVREEVRRYLD